MKTLKKITCITLAILCLGSVTGLHAEDNPSRREKLKEKLKEKGYDGTKVLEKYDTDKNGKLSDEEKAVMKADGIKKFDKNGDGTLDEAEKKSAREEFKAKIKEKKTGSTGSTTTPAT